MSPSDRFPSDRSPSDREAGAGAEPADRFRFDLVELALGTLPADELAALEAHLPGCAVCPGELASLRATLGQLDGVPGELFLDGPPADAELLVARTLRRLDDERAPGPARERVRGPRLMLVAAAAAAVVVGVAFGVGRATESSRPQAAGPAPSAADSAPVPGTKVFSATDATTGARLTGRLTPASGWVRLDVAASGIPQGRRCVLQVVPDHGAPVTAGSWVVSAAGAATGTSLQGSALVPIDDVAGVRVVTTTGQVYVTVPV